MSHKYVWILGAGFSRPLGGPLIDDLLAFRELNAVESFFSSNQHPKIADEIFKARLFFRYGKKLGYWAHAEQFLDLVETAATKSESHAHLMLRPILRGTVRYPETVEAVIGTLQGPVQNFSSLQDLAVAARRALVADCSTFLRMADPDTEHWAPFRQWADSLDEHHTVVTFNYDCVPDILEAAEGRLAVLDPAVIQDHQRLDEAVTRIRESGRAPVFKVHGSTNWLCHDGVLSVSEDAEAAVYPDNQSGVVVGIPGPTKRSLCMAALRRLWVASLEAVKDADSIIFVGYRFPPTDSDSRSSFLKAIRDNAKSRMQGDRSNLLILGVLGPTSPQTQRLESLIRTATYDHFPDLNMLDLYAEDYLALRDLV